MKLLCSFCCLVWCYYLMWPVRQQLKYLFVFHIVSLCIVNLSQDTNLLHLPQHTVVSQTCTATESPTWHWSIPWCHWSPQLKHFPWNNTLSYNWKCTHKIAIKNISLPIQCFGVSLQWQIKIHSYSRNICICNSTRVFKIW